ncbi:MAG TPA: proline-rich domain-containing protein [Nocardioidaceae bacterium]|nr:proline-rich domain-containing protein [Nocardioidaceae bacterium]
MSETPQPGTPQAQTTGAPEVPPQTRGQEAITPPSAPAAQPERVEAPPEPTGWAGWVVFAAMMMIMVGTFQVISGLTALFNSGYYVVGEQSLLVSIDFTGWGWAHIILGAVAVGAAFGLLAGQMWARIVGIAMALVSAVVNLAFIEAYPVWSILVIALDVVVIYAIAMHGKEVKAAGL